jgi:DGQHR domain-containing protein
MSKITHTGPKKGKISKAIEIPCFEFTQGKYKLYAFVLDAKTAWSVFSISRMTEDDEDDEDFGYQRILSPARLSNITRYITSGKPIPNSILVSLDKADYDAHKRILKIPKGTDVAWVIDGQHRLAGAFQASQSKHNISLLVVAFIGLTEKEQVEQFITINDEARGVPRSILLDLNRRLSFAKTEKEISEDRAGDIANGLRRDSDSIFFNKITVVESPKTGQISLANFVRKVASLVHPSKGILRTRSLVEQTKIIDNYFSAFRDVFPGEWRKADNVFLKTIGFGALMNAFEDVYIRTRDLYDGFRVNDVAKLLKPIIGFDFSAWTQYGTGNKAEQAAGKDLCDEISKAADNVQQKSGSFPL